MFPEDGCLHIYGLGDDGTTAFTEYGIECLKQIIADERAAGQSPKLIGTRPAVVTRLSTCAPPCIR